jgi:molecular chaperone GrpE (heat shock protein)
MSERDAPSSARWWFYVPFLLGDLILIGAAVWICRQGNRPLLPPEVWGLTFCLVMGAWLAVWPFLARHRAELRMLELEGLKTTLEQLQRLEEVAQSINAATGNWQTAHEHSVEAVNSARGVMERMAAETKEFFAFLEKADQAERSHLRLEVEKLRRAEAEWVQVLVRIMDHVYALYGAGVRSGQTNLIEQLGAFQQACRDIARRIGFVPLVAAPGTPFDSSLHQLPRPDTPVPPGTVIAETIATGYSYQGQVLRIPVVSVHSGEPASAESAATPSVEGGAESPPPPELTEPADDAS